MNSLSVVKNAALFVPTLLLISTIYTTVISPFAYRPCKVDTEHIEEAVLGYISNFFLNDYEAMEVHLHDRLSKRGVNADGTLSAEYPKEALKKLMENKPVLPKELQKNEIIDITIHTNVATVIMETGYPNTRWKEYIHLAKLDGKWIIMDIFWDFETTSE